MTGKEPTSLQAEWEAPPPEPGPKAAPKQAEAAPHYDLVVEAGRGERRYWRDLWHYRELFYFLAWRDILVRYKQTVIGIAWALLRPLLTILVFTVVFGQLAGMAEGTEAPYAVLVCAALLPWQFFANALSECGGSVLANANLIAKVYFPRIIAPISAVIVSLVDFAISGVILVGLMVYYGYVPTWRIVTLPLFVLLALVAALGAGLWLSALTVKYRDFRYIVPFLVQIGLYVSPVGFSSSRVPDQWRLLYSLNPMVGVIDGFRWAIVGGPEEIYWPGMLLSVALVGVLFVSGLWYFRRTERSFADIL